MPSTLAPSGKNVMLGKGVLYFDEFDASTGVRTGELDLGNCQTFSITHAVTKVTQKSSRDKAAGEYASAVTEAKATIKITGSEFSKENMALATLGGISSLVQASSTATAEPFCAKVVLGRYFPLAHRSVSTVVVKQGATTLVANTDYTVDAVRGRIYFKPGGAATAGTAATCDYAYAAVTLDTVDGLTTSSKVGYLRFVGDPTAGPAVEAEVWRADLAPDGEMNFIADDFGNWTLTGDALNDVANHPSSPYYHLIYS